MQLSSRAESEEGMERKEIIDGLKDLIKDRESFITEGEPESWKTDTDKIFEHDKQVLEEAINTIEAQQQEIRLLSMEIAELRESTQALKAYAENIEADKDAQAEKLKLMETVLKGARTALELLRHMNPEEFCFVFEVRCAIDALLGGGKDD
jgi:hypothetical protein